MIHYVTSLPPSGEPNALYVLEGGDNKAQLYATSQSGDLYDVASDAVIEALAQAKVDDAITTLIGSAPSTLDTIQELADALSNNPDAITNLTTQVGLKANTADVYTRTQADATTASLQSSIDAKQGALSNAAEVAKLGDGTYDGKTIMLVGTSQW